MSAAAADSSSSVSAAPACHLRYVLRLGDTSLILGQRLAEWVGHAPALEEDLGLANISLDLIGQARLLLSYAGQLEGQGRDEDALAFLRDAPAFANVTLAEQPNGDFGRTIVRQVLLDAWQLRLYEGLTGSSDRQLAGIAAKALKETSYHLRFSSGWLVRLGDGTEESHRRVQEALNQLWPYTVELFAADAIDDELTAAGVAPSLQSVQRAWDEQIDEILREATLRRPEPVPYQWYGKQGVHSEHLSHLLTEMQHLQRTYPGVQW